MSQSGGDVGLPNGLPDFSGVSYISHRLSVLFTELLLDEIHGFVVALVLLFVFIEFVFDRFEHFLQLILSSALICLIRISGVIIGSHLLNGKRSGREVGSYGR